MSDFLQVVSACRDRGFRCNCFVDVGANNGDIAIQFRRIFPDAAGYMVEPNPHLQGGLQGVQRKHNIAYLPVACGAEDRRDVLRFNLTDGYRGGSLRVNPATRGNDFFDQFVEVQQRSLDSLLATGEIAPPNLLKLDVEGMELEVLNGAKTVLPTVEIVCLETMLFRNWVTHPKFSEVIDYMQRIGFVVYDFGAFGRRPYDKALMVVDLVFAREDSPLRSYHDWA